MSKGKDTTFESRVFSTLYNPFSHKNYDPKWPDGLATVSQGVKMQACTEVVGSELLVALVPGIVNWCIAFQWDEGINRPIVRLNHCDTKFTHSLLQSKQITQLTNTESGEVTNMYGFDGVDPVNLNANDFAAWRGVSYGLRMQNINSDHENDGWFECIRTSRSATKNRLGVLVDAHTVDAGYDDFWMKTWTVRGKYEKENIELRPGSLMPLNHLAQEWFSARNWALMPSYASGKLRELKDFVFQLNPEKRNNNFNETKFQPFNYTFSVPDGTSSIELMTGMGENPNDITDIEKRTETGIRVMSGVTEYQDAVSTAYSEQFVEVVNQLVSDNFDIILIKIHGLTNTRTIIESCANLEVIVNERKVTGYHNMTNCYACTDALDRYIEKRTTYHRSPFSDYTKNRS